MAFLCLGTLVSCATGPEIGGPPPARLPVPTQLPSPPVPDSIPGATDDAAVGTVTPTQQGRDIAGGPVSGSSLTRGSINDPGHPLARRIIFFDYNSSELRQQSIELIKLHAEYLSSFRDVRVRLEGHTDERGSREYNIALGDNRSRSVARILGLQGVEAGQYSTLSYGEEVPLDEGQGENSYRRNRRVELVYEGLN
ncbi:hypothetical protein AB833_08895 [Chromatiales bacterium (ex Bugula neritina AB1)]|nr:hypothetical protein AB833_08895 [Chromatiales bacterium (ex Bugula neritina AB1)]